MKKPVYIKSVGSVSAQKTFENDQFLEEIIPLNDTVIKVVDPNYKEYIPPAAARRMAKGIKMSTVSAKNALNESNLEDNELDAIIVGTGLGCIGDSEKFVGDIIKNNEQFLTPTRFIQSSHNTVAGQIALGLGCKGYNFTYVHSAISFESALLDAKMQLEENEANSILVGGVDELVNHHIDTHRLIEHIKKTPVDSTSLYTEKSKGAIFSEGAHFFVVTNKQHTDNYAQLLAIQTFNTLTPLEAPDSVQQFLKQNGLSPEDIDLIILGANGDVEFDVYYNQVVHEVFKNIPQARYKHLSGEYDTASAFGFWVANKIFKHGRIPEQIIQNDCEVLPKTILLYNQYRGENHSLILLQKC